MRALLDLAAASGARLVPVGRRHERGRRRHRPGTPRPARDRGPGRARGRDRPSTSAAGLVTAGAGTTGPALADHLAPLGLVVGHEPQSWELASVGGWVAARGAGLRSVGARPDRAAVRGRRRSRRPPGRSRCRRFPPPPRARTCASSCSARRAGWASSPRPCCGRPRPRRSTASTRGPCRDWASAQEAVRVLARTRPGLSVLRVSTPAETRTLLALAGRSRGLDAVGSWLRLRRVPGDWSLLLMGVAGQRRVAKAARAEAGSVVKRLGGVPVPGFANAWLRTRFRSPYLRNALWSAGYGADTLETATDWSRVPALLAGLEAAIANALAAARRAGPRVDPPVPRLPVGLEPVPHLRVPAGRRPGREPRSLARRSSARRRTRSSRRARPSATITASGTDHAPYLAAEKGDAGHGGPRGGRPGVRSRRPHEPGRAPRRTDPRERATGSSPSTSARRASGRWCSTRAGELLARSRGPDRALRPRSTGLLRAGRRPLLAGARRGLRRRCGRCPRDAGTRWPASRSRPSAGRSW